MNSVPTSKRRSRPRTLPFTANCLRCSSVSRIRLPELRFQRSILSLQVIDHFLLLSIEPSREDGEKQLPWREDDIHVVPREVRRVETLYREAFSTPIAKNSRSAK